MATDLDIKEIYLKHGPHVLRRAYHLLGSEAEASDVLHDIFIDLMARPHQFNGASTPGTFLYAATTNACLGRLRKHRNRCRVFDKEVAPWITEIDPRRADAVSDVCRVIEQLTNEEACAAILYHLDGMTYSEVAKVLHCSPSHVGNLIKRVARRTAEHKVES
jgi:RNA polymerase sigma factor (sigma-70 family)